MNFELTAQQARRSQEFRKLVDEHVVPQADAFDREERIPDALIRTLGGGGCLLPALPAALGGGGLDAISCGALYEQIGRGSGSVANLLTVAGMVGQAIWRGGDPAQQQRWLPRLASGELVGAYALTEPEIGSDAANVGTTARRDGDGYVLDGQKKWISFGQRADVFVVFARCEQRPTAFVLERGAPGLQVQPISGLLGLRGSLLAELRFDGCRVPAAQRLGSEGSGFAWVAAASLDQGRYSTACGAVGLAQACLDACLRYTRSRRQFGAPIRSHQLVQQMITDMVANSGAARLLCQRAGFLRDHGDPESIRATLVAKYFASRTAYQAAGDAVQVHGASGCGSEHPVQRYFRDAKIMEIIEGTTQIHQIKIAEMS